VNEADTFKKKISTQHKKKGKKGEEKNRPWGQVPGIRQAREELTIDSQEGDVKEGPGERRCCFGTLRGLEKHCFWPPNEKNWECRRGGGESRKTGIDRIALPTKQKKERQREKKMGVAAKRILQELCGGGEGMKRKAGK